MRSTFKERFSQSQSDPSINQSFNEGASFEDDNEQYLVLLFIKQLQDGRLQLQEDCLEIISSTEQPISFICIIGEDYNKYGEIANVICEIKQSGFLNESVRGNQGAWMYTKPSYNAKTNSVVYYILAKQTQQQHINPKILSLISLISGSMIYVATDPLNTHSLDLLRFTSELEQHIIFNSKDFSFQLEELMPTLNWLIITDKKSSAIKDQIQQYLSGFDPNKKAIKTFFANRIVYTISLQQQKRKTQLNQSKKKILLNTSNKALQYHNIESGFIAAIMIQRLADNINTDAIRLDQIWKQINNTASKTAYHSAVTHYIQMYQNNFSSQQPKGEQLYDMLKQMKNQTVQEFDRNAIKGQSQGERVKLFQFLQNHEVSIVEANLTACQMHNLKLLKDIKTKVQTNYKNGKYINKQILDEDLKQYIDEYNEQGKGSNKQTLLNKFQSNFRGVFQTMIQDQPPPQVNNLNPPNLIFTLGAPQSSSHVRQLEDKVQQLQRKLQSKQMNNSLVMKKQLQRVELQNQAIRNQMSNLNNKNTQKPKTQKCCLLF